MRRKSKIKSAVAWCTGIFGLVWVIGTVFYLPASLLNPLFIFMNGLGIHSAKKSATDKKAWNRHDIAAVVLNISSICGNLILLIIYAGLFFSQK